jgi:hypothetical protein
MEKLLNMLVQKLRRKIEMSTPFLDSPTCHPKVTLLSVKNAWFPANATGVLQPMDMGSDAIFDLECRRSESLSRICKICIGS